MARKCSQTDQSVFELSKTCVINIIKQKIFAETKNEYLFIEFGNNYDESDVKVNGSLCSPNFDLLRYISQLSPSLTQSNGLSFQLLLNIKILIIYLFIFKTIKYWKH